MILIFIGSRVIPWWSVWLLTWKLKVRTARYTLGFSYGVSLRQDTSEPQPSTDDTHEVHEYVSFCRDITELILKNTIYLTQSISIWLLGSVDTNYS